MTVEIQVNWNFRSGDDEAHVSYRTEPLHALESREQDEIEQPLGRVVPIGSSVLAPGLSLPISRH